MLASYTMGDLKQWEVNLRWNFGTGFPFTELQGYFEKLLFPGGINSDYVTEKGIMGIQYAGLNQGRLPTYHRLDFNVKRLFFLGEHTELQADFSVTNIYDRANVFYVNCLTSGVVPQLPIMPSLGLTRSF